MNVLLNKGLSKVIDRVRFCFSEIRSDNNVYKLGGVVDSSKDSFNEGGRYFHGDEIMKGFEKAYISILEGFEQNDNEILR